MELKNKFFVQFQFVSHRTDFLTYLPDNLKTISGFRRSLKRGFKGHESAVFISEKTLLRVHRICLLLGEFFLNIYFSMMRIPGGAATPNASG